MVKFLRFPEVTSSRLRKTRLSLPHVPGRGFRGHATRGLVPRPHGRAKQKPPVSRPAFPQTVFRFRPSNPLISSFILFIRGRTPCPHAALHLDTRAPPTESFISLRNFSHAKRRGCTSESPAMLVLDRKGALVDEFGARGCPFPKLPIKRTSVPPSSVPSVFAPQAIPPSHRPPANPPQRKLAPPARAPYTARANEEHAVSPIPSPDTRPAQVSTPSTVKPAAPFRPAAALSSLVTRPSSLP